MGYIFDALSRGRPESDSKTATKPDPKPAGPSPAAPEPEPNTTPIFDALDQVQTAMDEVTEQVAPASAGSGPPKPPRRKVVMRDTPDPRRRSHPEVEAADEDGFDPTEVEDLVDDVPIGAPAGQVLAEADPEWLKMIDDRLVMLLEPSSQQAEEYRSIRTSLLARINNARHRVHLITSATPQEGKTITSVNLGLSFQELTNRKTLIIESDLRLPNIDRLMQLNAKPGLITHLRGECSLDEAIQIMPHNGLHVITAGGRSNNDAVQLLASQAMAQLLHEVRQRYDHILVDTPPVIELADAGILGAQSDDVLLIARMQRTPRTLIQQAIRTLSSYNAPVAGVIATDNRRHLGRGYYRYGYRYGYRYSYTRGSKRGRGRRRLQSA